jgi:serine/threonine protein kinase
MPTRRATTTTFRTFLALAIVAALVGLTGGWILLSKVQKTYVDLQMEANAQQAIRLANLLENRLAQGVPAETVIKDLQRGLETLPRDDSGFYCVFGNGGKLLCHPNPQALGAEKGGEQLHNGDSVISFNDLVTNQKGGGGLLEHQTAGGKTQIVFSQPVKGTSWQVNVHTDFAVIEGRVAQLRLVILGTLLPSLLVLVGLGTFATRWAAKRYESELESANSQLTEAIEVSRKTNLALAQAKRETETANKDLAEKITELEASHQRADRIFSALAQALPGTVLDEKYRLDRSIGAGGFGAVFAATQLNLNRPVAVKVFRPSPGNDSAAAVERFRREGVTTSRISHPNAIAVLDSGVSETGIPYLVMELLEGTTLTQELKQYGRFPLARCADILVPACHALAAAHAAGVVHRDIKPDNIFLHRSTLGETVKVLDFGIARLETNDGSGKLTETGLIIGTPSYMSPERLTGETYGEKADVYAMGIVAYEMIAGRKPFAGPTNNLQFVLEMLKNDPPPLHEFLPNVPLEVESIVLRAISRNPDVRPTAEQFADEFLNAVSKLMDAGATVSGSFPRNSTAAEEPTLLDRSGEVTSLLKPEPAGEERTATFGSIQG